VSLYENACEKYDKAAQLDPNNAYAFSRWGIALHRLAEIKEDVSLYENACEKYDKVTQLDPNDDSSFNNWGIALHRLAEINEDVSLYEYAFEKYEKATQLDTNDNFAFISWGNALSSLAEINKDVSLYENAFKKYEKAMQLASDDVSVFKNWGITLFSLSKINKDEDFQKNLKIFDKASEKIDDSDINLIKGELYFILYQTEKKQEYENEVKKYFKKTKKSILEILTFLEKDNEEKIIQTEILHSLLDLKTIENGKFFIETIGSQPKEQLKKYKDIYIHSIFIISLLHVNDENEKRVAHYREKNISQKLLFDSDSKFRLNAIDFSNDPSEGKTLLDFLYGKEKNPDDEKLSNEEYEAFAGCFVFDYDNLNMFRLYGKNEHGNEGTGLSLVFKDSFFSKEAKMVLGSPKTDSFKNNDDSIEKDKLTLFRCIYIDPIPKNDRHITVGRKEEYLFYREELGDKFEAYNDKMKGIIEQVEDEMNKLKELVNDKGLNSVIVGQLLLNLRYLVKHIAFKEEQECRILKIHHILDEEIQIKDKDNKNDDYKRMFIEYSPASMHIDKIYFGPKATDFDLFKSILKNKRLNITCHKSENPFA
jgi:tetratricopeptide (TPR) repeat protein